MARAFGDAGWLAYNSAGFAFAVTAGTGAFSPQGWFALVVGLTFAVWLLTISVAAWRSTRLPATIR